MQSSAARAGLAVIICCLFSVLALPFPAQAGWWKVLKGAGDLGDAGKLGRRHLPDGFGALDDAARHIQGVSAISKGVPLAAHATPEGHWKFVNKDGEVYTAGSADEMARVVPTLAPDASDSTKLSFYLSDATVFDQRQFLSGLPANADLYFVDGKASYRISRGTGKARDEFSAVIRPNIAVPLVDRRMFDEVVFQLNRTLNKSNIRMLALQPGGPKRLSSAPSFEPGSKTALVDAIDPQHIGQAFSSLRGQTVVVTARVDGGRIHATPVTGDDFELPLDTLTRAAESNDVNLVVLQASVPKQPGGRNWLWQKIEVSGLSDALERATFADFLDALAASRGELKITAAPAGQGRISLSTVPSGDWPEPVTDDVFSEIFSHVTGNIITQSVQVVARDERAQREHDARIVTWLPSVVHVMYGLSLVIGLITLPVTRSWWRRLWPTEQRAEYRSAVGYYAARLVRGAAFLLLFVPIAAWPALPVQMARVVWGYLMLPVRFVRWMRGTPTPAAT